MLSLCGACELQEVFVWEWNLKAKRVCGITGELYVIMTICLQLPPHKHIANEALHSFFEKRLPNVNLTSTYQKSFSTFSAFLVSGWFNSPHKAVKLQQTAICFGKMLLHQLKWNFSPSVGALIKTHMPTPLHTTVTVAEVQRPPLVSPQLNTGHLCQPFCHSLHF